MRRPILPAYRQGMTITRWAEAAARELLETTLPRRWVHTRGVAATAATIARTLGADAEILEAAAWLHDIGYSPALAVTGFHPLDGARWLRDTSDASGLLCRLVANHSCAMTEARLRGLGAELAREFPLPPASLLDALTWSDMTTGPDGQRVPVGKRLTEITARYGPGHIVSLAISESVPELTAAVRRVTSRLAAGAETTLAPIAMAESEHRGAHSRRRFIPADYLHTVLCPRGDSAAFR